MYQTHTAVQRKLLQKKLTIRLQAQETGWLKCKLSIIVKKTAHFYRGFYNNITKNNETETIKAAKYVTNIKHLHLSQKQIQYE